MFIKIENTDSEKVILIRLAGIVILKLGNDSRSNKPLIYIKYDMGSENNTKVIYFKSDEEAKLAFEKIMNHLDVK